MRLKIKEALERSGKTQKWLAEETGVSVPTISRYTNAKRGTRFAGIIVKICEALHCDPNFLFGYETEKKEISLWNQIEE